jgi:hypothetical protein
METKKQRVFAVSGWRFSGKDTFYKLLKENRENENVDRVGIADRLKEMVAAEFDVPLEAFHDPEQKNRPLMHLPVELDQSNAVEAAIYAWLEREFYHCYNGRCYWTPRALAIYKGMLNRAVVRNYWIKQLCEKTIPDMFSVDNADIVCVTDVRFKSEMELLKETFCEQLTTIRIERFDASPSEDSSENDLNDYDFDVYIKNVGTTKDFENAIFGSGLF